MKKEEKDYLKIVKKSNNYNYGEADESIRDFIDSQKQFKILVREGKKKDTVIRNQLKKIEKLEEKLRKKEKPVLNIKKSNNQKGKEIFLADVSEEEYKKNKPEINRMSRHMEDKYYTKTDIKKELLINYKKLDFCIGYLLDKGIIKEKIINGNVKYKKVDGEY